MKRFFITIILLAVVFGILAAVGNASGASGPTPNVTRLDNCLEKQLNSPPGTVFC